MRLRCAALSAVACCAIAFIHRQQRLYGGCHGRLLDVPAQEHASECAARHRRVHGARHLRPRPRTGIRQSGIKTAQRVAIHIHGTRPADCARDLSQHADVYTSCMGRSKRWRRVAGTRASPLASAAAARILAVLASLHPRDM